VGVIVGVSVGVSVGVGVGVEVGVLVLVGGGGGGGCGVFVGVGVTPQPFRALFTAVRISSIVISLSLLASPAGHAESCAFCRAISTMVTMSVTVTFPLLLQSPVHCAGLGVGEGVGVCASAPEHSPYGSTAAPASRSGARRGRRPAVLQQSDIWVSLAPASYCVAMQVASASTIAGVMQVHTSGFVGHSRSEQPSPQASHVVSSLR
jgi:hypothetical protein